VQYLPPVPEKSGIQAVKWLMLLALSCSESGSVNYYYDSFMALWILSGTTWVSQCLDLLEQEIVNASGISWTVCKSAPHPKQITVPASNHSVFTGRMPFLPFNQQC